MLKKKKHIINGLFIVFPITVLYNNFAFWNIAMEGKKMSAKKSKMKNLTEGSPAKLIIGFAIPMFLGMLFQQFYSMVDTMIVGKFLGLKPLAGVGSTGSLNFMVIGFCIGVCNGFAIPVTSFCSKRHMALCRFCGRDDTGIVCFLQGYSAFFADAGGCISVCLLVYADHISGNSMYLFI